MKNRVRTILLFVFLMMIFSLTRSSYSFGQLFFFENPLIGKQAPDFTLKTLSGKSMNLNQWRKGDPAIIFFWATWCPHCRQQLGELNDQSQQIAQKGIKLILVDLGEEAKKVRSYMEKNQYPFEVFLDQDSSVSEKYGIIGVPTFFFVDKAGIIQAVEHAIPENYDKIFLEENKGEIEKGVEGKKEVKDKT